MVAITFTATFTTTYLWLRKAAGAAVLNAVMGSSLMALAFITAGRVWGLI